MRFARIALIALFSGFLVIVLAGCIERMFFYPDSATYTTPAQLGVRAEDVRIVTADGSRLHGWFLPAVGNAKGTVLHLHGNAANVSNHLPLGVLAAGTRIQRADGRLPRIRSLRR